RTAPSPRRGAGERGTPDCRSGCRARTGGWRSRIAWAQQYMMLTPAGRLAPVPGKLPRVRRRVLALSVVGAALFAPAAGPHPVAPHDGQYAQYGRAWPDPLGGCQASGVQPCSPNAEGKVPATQFIQYSELIDGLTYLQSKAAWRRYLEVWPLDGRLGPGSGH